MAAGGGASSRARTPAMNRTLYIVDDQVSVLVSAALILRTINRDWEVRQFTDPREALAAVKDRAPDLVLSDERMPDMAGSQLLENVRAISPTTVRVIMSGCVPLDHLKVITSAHQFLAKPFEVARLRELVKRSLAARDRLVDPGLQKVLAALRSLPSLPQVHQALLRELKDDRTATTAIARLVAEDPGLSSKVLHLANSPLFGRGCLVSSPVDAVRCLGTEFLAAIVLSQSLFRRYETLKRPELDPPRVWSHCWAAALLAKHFCREQRLAAAAGEAALLAGLLHEIGRFVLLDNFPDQFRAAYRRAGRSASPLATCLKEELQASPAQIGACLLELWGLPDTIVAAVEAVDTPAADPADGFTVNSALYIADHIAHERFPPDALPVMDWNTDYLRSLGCVDQIPVWEEFSTQADLAAAAN
jgi:HD-like signal output (HDOD) protein